MISKILGLVISLLSFGAVLQSTIIWHLLCIYRECMVWLKRSSSACLASWVTTAWQMLSTWPSSQMRKSSWWRALRPCGAFRRSWPCERRSLPKCSQCHKLQTSESCLSFSWPQISLPLTIRCLRPSDCNAPYISCRKYCIPVVLTKIMSLCKSLSVRTIVYSTKHLWTRCAIWVLFHSEVN